MQSLNIADFYCFIMSKIDPPLYPLFVLKVPFRIQLYQKRRRVRMGRVGCRIILEIAQAISFISSRNHLAHALHKLGNVLSAGVNQMYLTPIKKKCKPCCFLFLLQPLLPASISGQVPFCRGAITRGRTDKEHKSSKNPRVVAQ